MNRIDNEVSQFDVLKNHKLLVSIDKKYSQLYKKNKFSNQYWDSSLKKERHWHMIYFISLSMPEHLIAEYLEQANCIGGVVLLQGIPKGWSLRSFFLKKLLPLVQSYPGGNHLAIDPVAFEKYHVTQVPQMVFISDKHKPIFQLAGAVSTAFALKLFKEEGAFIAEAKTCLQQCCYHQNR